MSYRREEFGRTKIITTKFSVNSGQLPGSIVDNSNFYQTKINDRIWVFTNDV